MSVLQKKSEHFLKLLLNSSTKRRRVLLQSASRAEILALAEICLNILHGSADVSPGHKRKLYRHREALRKLAYGGVSRWKDHKRTLVNQSGGNLLPTIISLALSALGGLL